MRPVVLQMGVTLDGFVHGAKGYEDWDLPAEEDDVVEWKATSLREAGTHIMGRTTYEDMAAVWPKSTGVYVGPDERDPQRWCAPRRLPSPTGRRAGSPAASSLTTSTSST